TSGGVFGLERGYCLMVGGTDEAYQRLEPILKTIAPGRGDVPRTPGRSGDFAPEELGYLHCGPADRKSTRLNSSHGKISYAVLRRPASPTLFPYTTFFRSARAGACSGSSAATASWSAEPTRPISASSRS